MYAKRRVRQTVDPVIQKSVHWTANKTDQNVLQSMVCSRRFDMNKCLVNTCNLIIQYDAYALYHVRSP